MWKEAKDSIPSPEKDKFMSREVFCLVDGVPSIGQFFYYDQKVNLTYANLRTGERIIGQEEFFRVQWCEPSLLLNT